MATTIVTKNSSTASAVPTAAQLVQGELAVNVADKRIYTENNAGAIVELGTNPSSLTVSGNIDVDGTTNLDVVDIDGAVDMASTLTVAGEITANGGIALGDNDKATFGDSDDLQIYHDGSGSYIDDAGTGNLFVRADNLQLRRADGSHLYLAANTGAEVALYHAGNSKLATTATGIDVTGTATMDGLTVTGTLGNFAVDTQGAVATFSRPSTSYIRASDVSGSLRFDAGGSLARLNIAANGDISFYEDTGTTAKLFWDASAESLGIGTSSPSAAIHAYTAALAITPLLKLQANISDNTGTQGASIDFVASGDATAIGSRIVATRAAAGANMDLRFHTGRDAERMRIDNVGNVGIGISTPSAKLHLGTAGSEEIGIGLSNNQRYYGIQTTGGALTFKDVSAGGTERMRIDSAGNLLVGKTATGFGTAGIELRSNGELWATTGVTNSASFNRTGSYGAVITINSANTPVGSIGTAGGGLTIGNGDTGVFFDAGNDNIRPFSLTTNNSLDAAIDLGRSTTRFKDLYLSGGVYLGGTGAANLLDDYEEGTTSMTWSDGTNHSGVVVGKYTKVGRIVTVEGNIGGSLSGLTQTNDILISGFPFVFNAKGSFSLLTRYLNAPDNTNSVIGYHDSSGSTALVFFVVDNGTYVTAKVQDFNQNTNDTYFSLTYTTA